MGDGGGLGTVSLRTCVKQEDVCASGGGLGEEGAAAADEERDGDGDGVEAATGQASSNGPAA